MRTASRRSFGGSGEAGSAAYSRHLRSGHRAADRHEPGVAEHADRHAVRLVSAPGQRRHRPGRDRLAHHRQHRRLAVAPRQPRRPDRQAASRGRARHRVRRRLQLAVGPRLRPGVCRRAAKGRRLGGAAGVQATGGERRGRLVGPRQPAAAGVRQERLVGDRQRRRRGRRPGAALFVRRDAGRQVPAVGRRVAGRQVREQRGAAPHRFQHPRGVAAGGVLRRRAARRSRCPRQAQGQEDHHRRDRDRARRPFQRAERRRHPRARAADAGGRIHPARPRAAHRLSSGHAGRAVADRAADAADVAPRLRAGARRGAGQLRSRGRGRRDAAAGQARRHPRHFAVASGDRRLSRRHGARRDRLRQPARRHRRAALPAHRHVAWRRPRLRRPGRPDHGLESGRGGDLRLRRRTR